MAIEAMERCELTLPDVSVRVEWALQTVKELGGIENAELGIRALRAAVPDETDIEDEFLRRKWLLFLGVMEIGVGRAGEAIQHLVSSLELARRIGDGVGVFMAWGNAALLASMAGQYEDAVKFSTRAIELIEDEERRSGVEYGKFLAGPLFNRGNAFRRLGRLEEAVGDVSSSLALSFLELTCPLPAYQSIGGSPSCKAS